MTSNAKNSTCFISTALPYVNARPHLGFALELAIADTLARARRRRGDDVCFVSGTDENSLKNVLAAERTGQAFAAFIAENAERFRELARQLDVSLDAFVRTSADPSHPATVKGAWHRLAANGDLYRAGYRGLYCRGCEQFYQENELRDGACPEHLTPPEVVEEVNWFFRLSRYREQLLEIVTSGAVRIEPESARRDTINFLHGEVRDLSVSRDAERARGLGVSVPSDPTQVVYVWVDALFGYLTALADRRAHYWTDAAERTHVIGKGITRFHAVYWLALLLATGEELPRSILVHGYLTLDGQKVSKSGSSLDPFPLIRDFGADAVRYFLLRHVRTTRDGDFSLPRFVTAHDSELANQLGNLLSRVLALVDREVGGHVPAAGSLTDEDRALLARAQELGPLVADSIETFELNRGLDLAFSAVEETNRYIERTEPWALARRAELDRVASVLHVACAALVRIAHALEPFLPRTSEAILAALGASRDARHLPVGARITRGAPLFPRQRRANNGTLASPDGLTTNERP